MPLIKSKSKKAMSKNIEAEMNAGKPQNQSVAIAYDIMRRARKRKMALGGAVEPEDHDQEGERKDNSRSEPESLQEDMIHDHPSDEEDRSNVLFDGKAERIDPLKKEYREDQSSIHMGRTDLEDDDNAAEDIVSRIMRKMRRK